MHLNLPRVLPACSSPFVCLMQISPFSLSLSGTAIRHCDEHKGWLPPNLFNCTSVTFTKLKALVCTAPLQLAHIYMDQFTSVTYAIKLNDELILLL